MTPETEALLCTLGKRLGEEGFIFIGGLIPYEKKITGPGWDVDFNKPTIRLSNIEEATSARVTMSLMAYLMEEMQAELATELGVNAIPGLKDKEPV